MQRKDDQQRQGFPMGAKMADLVQAFDWAKTSLGPIESWPPSLTFVVELMLKTSQPTMLAMGPDRLLLYNDEAALLYGARHPAAFGKPLAAASEQAFDIQETFYDRAFSGESVHVPAWPFDPGEPAAPRYLLFWNAPQIERSWYRLTILKGAVR